MRHGPFHPLHLGSCHEGTLLENTVFSEPRSSSAAMGGRHRTAINGSIHGVVTTRRDSAGDSPGAKRLQLGICLHKVSVRHALQYTHEAETRLTV
jgi:hypothetical protein